MARIVVVGSVASDQLVRLGSRMREGCHLDGRPGGVRLGGGGANTAVALAAAGHHVSLVAAVGEDADGEWQLQQLRAAGVDTAAVARVAAPSTRSILLVDPEGERTIVNLGRADEPDPPARLLDIPADLVYVRARRADLGALLRQALARSTVVAHVPPLAPEVFPAHVILASAADLDAAALADPVATARGAAGASLRWMVLTRGPAGAEAFSPSGGRVAVSADAVAAVDSTGAGDAFAAGLCHALAGGEAMETALAVAARWGTEKVRHPGSALEGRVVRRLLAPARTEPADRHQRQAEALRANLARRKAQARARAEGDG